MWALYNGRLNNILDKDYENISWKNAWERLLKQVIRDWNKIQFWRYLKYLIESWQIDSNNNYDDIDQIWDLQDQLGTLKEQVEEMWSKDFQIVEWSIWDYEFRWSDNFEYLWSNFYAVKIDFSKIKHHNINSWINIKKTYTKWDIFFIHYDGNNVIKYYSWRNFEDKKLVWHEVIDHKQELVKQKKWYKKEIYYERWAKEKIYLKELEMNLTLKFFQKEKTD
jgi:hypothetical protein